MEIGIDLGTTNSVGAVVRDGRPVCIPSAEGQDLVPSVVGFTKDGPCWVGRLARNQASAPSGPEITTVRSIKRHMGSADKIATVAGDYTPEAISALILGKLKRDAEAWLGEAVEQAVITVPAYFNDAQRRATRDAGAMAGLEVLRIINEPTAAALAYGLDQAEIHTVAVWDLGGGTYDVSLLELGEGTFRVRAVGGDTHLGGDDWDGRIVELLREQIRARTAQEPAPSARTDRRLYEAAEQIKIRLSSRDSTITLLPADLYDRARYGDIELSRARFEQITADLQERLLAPARQAMADADVDPLEVDRVLLVGGSTRMPMVRALSRKFFGREPFASIDPDRVVALGAAVQAAVLSGRRRNVVLMDVTPLTLSSETQGGIASPIIRRNAQIPATESLIVTNASDNQTAMDIRVVQGERTMAAQNHLLGTLTVDHLVALGRGQGRYEIVFHIDADGILQVRATELQTGLSEQLVIRSARKLSADEIRTMVAEAAEFRAEDAEQLAGVRAAIRADSMIRAAELVLDDIDESRSEQSRGERLYQAIDALRDPLARQDRARIEELTHALQSVIREVKSAKTAENDAAEQVV